LRPEWAQSGTFERSDPPVSRGLPSSNYQLL
jgi:hypothetical protein